MIAVNGQTTASGGAHAYKRRGDGKVCGEDWCNNQEHSNNQKKRKTQQKFSSRKKMSQWGEFTETLRKLSQKAEKNEAGLCGVISKFEEKHFSLNTTCDDFRAHVEEVMSEYFKRSLVSKTIKNGCAVGRGGCANGKCGS